MPTTVTIIGSSTYIDPSSPNTNYSTAGYLAVGQDANGDMGFCKACSLFDLSSIPSGSTISFVELGWNGFYGSNPGYISNDFVARRCTNTSWNPATTTYNTFPLASISSTISGSEGIGPVGPGANPSFPANFSGGGSSQLGIDVHAAAGGLLAYVFDWEAGPLDPGLNMLVANQIPGNSSNANFLTVTYTPPAPPPPPPTPPPGPPPSPPPVTEEIYIYALGTRHSVIFPVMISVAPPPPPPTNTYVAEDGTTIYTTEDGTEPYVPES